MNSLSTLIHNHVLLLDGGMGTQVQNFDLDLEKDFLGLENCTEVLNLSRGDVVQKIHATYFEAGSDAVETNTFGGLPHVLCEFDLQDRCAEINRAAVRHARAAANDAEAKDGRPRFVVGALGPGTKLVSLGQIDFDTMRQSYRTGVDALLDEGVDALLFETCQDLLQIKCALSATFESLHQRQLDIPVFVQVTIEQQGTTLTGSTIEAIVHALKPYPITGLGMNCATGPEDMAQHVKFLSKFWDRAITMLPNAGLPVLENGQTVYPMGPDAFAQKVAEYVDSFGLSVVGGCCGTTPEHIAALRRSLGEKTHSPQNKTLLPPSSSSLYNAVTHRQEASILNVGERCNASGSRAFKRLLEAEDWDEIVSLAREQIREGSHVLDVNVDYAGRDNARDMHEVVSRLVRQVDAPLMLDSSQIATLEAGLKAAPGKCILNSANFEDGDDKFDAICALAKNYGACVVLGTIDEDPEEAMARTAERKLSIASRAIQRATTLHGIPIDDLFVDPLVLPVSTGMDKDRRSGLELIEGIRRITAAYPEIQTTVGLSNVSFGLKPAARIVLNSVFQYELQQAGLTSAIVHASKILPKTRIEAEHWEAALDLIYNRWRAEDNLYTAPDGTTSSDPLQIFVSLFPDGSIATENKQTLADLPLEERLQKHIIDGEKRGLEDMLNTALQSYSPLEIINNHLLEGMKVVGELFGSGQMQLPFVLQSAEVMKQSVAFLEPHMEKTDGNTKGSIVLATVRGDVHDIGKNLVDIILTNNGYTVHNIGIKQPMDAILVKWQETQADAIGMSGLLVKSVNIMEENLRVLRDKGVQVPVLLGGAALAKNYCETHLRDTYGGSNLHHGKDAFEGLHIMNTLAAGKSSELEDQINTRNQERQQRQIQIDAIKAKSTNTPAPSHSKIARAQPIPKAPFLGSKIFDNLDIQQIYPFINENALFKTQWQFVRGDLDSKAYQQLLDSQARPALQRLRDELADTLKPRVAYGYFPCYAEDNDLVILDPETQLERERLHFPRQSTRDRLCVADYFYRKDELATGQYDVVGFQCVTMGTHVSEVAAKLYDAHQYKEYLLVHGMGVECAEALAEMWHKRMRQELGINTTDGIKISQLFTGKYQGCRYSWGYPACPEMSEHEKIWRLIDPTRIGCQLTESHQIDPEQSTVAIICHHKEAKYFAVNDS